MYRFAIPHFLCNILQLISSRSIVLWYVPASTITCAVVTPIIASLLTTFLPEFALGVRALASKVRPVRILTNIYQRAIVFAVLVMIALPTSHEIFVYFGRDLKK
jgi:hypothetical protein